MKCILNIDSYVYYHVMKHNYWIKVFSYDLDEEALDSNIIEVKLLTGNDINLNDIHRMYKNHIFEDYIRWLTLTNIIKKLLTLIKSLFLKEKTIKVKVIKMISGVRWVGIYHEINRVDKNVKTRVKLDDFELQLCCRVCRS